MLRLPPRFAGCSRRGPFRTSLRGIPAVGMLLALVLAVPSQGAQPRAARTAEQVQLPGLAPDASVDDAVRTLRRRGLRAAVMRVDGYPAARPGKVFVAAGWAIERRTTTVARDGKRRTVRRTYRAARAGSRHPVGTLIHVRPRQRPAGARLPTGSPSAPAPAALGASASDPVAASAPLPGSPVNAGGTPVVTGPPAAGLGGSAVPADAPAATAGTSGSAGAPQAPAPAPTTPPVDLAAATASYLRSDTVRLPFMNDCSGLLVRDRSGRAIGAVSAAHCGLLQLNDGTRVTVTRGGRSYVVTGKPLDVRNGDDTSRMRTIAVAESVTLAPDTDRTHDVALISFAGSGASVAQLRAAYEEMRLSPAEVRALPRGLPVHLSAFPMTQPGTTGPLRRQVMTGTVLGTAPVYTSTGRIIPTVWTGTRANGDGAVCSFGASGGAAVTARLAPGADGASTPVFRVLGVLAGYDDFRSGSLNTVTSPGYDGPKVRAERVAQTGFALDSVDATCDYAYELPEATTAQTLGLVASTADLPR